MPSVNFNLTTNAARHGGVSVTALIHAGATLWSAVTAPQTVPLRTALPKNGTARQIHSGHSLTDVIFYGNWPGGYNDMAYARGQQNDTASIRKSTIPGSTTKIRWDSDTDLPDGDRPREDIADYALLSMTDRVQPLAMPGQEPPSNQLAEDVDYLGRFATRARSAGRGGAGADVLLWTTWPSVDDSDGPFRATVEAYEEGWHYRQESVNALLAGGGYMHIIPGHRLLMRIYDDVQAGTVPGVTTFTSLFRDNIHPVEPGLVSYACACLTFAVVYVENPTGLPNLYVTAAQAAYCQQIAWEIATSYARAGLGGSDMGVSGGITPVEPPEDPGDLPVVTNGLQNPSVGFNFGGLQDWLTADPFANIAKFGSRWQGNGASRSAIDAVLDSNGWPTAMPAGTDHLTMYLLWDHPPEAIRPGQYRIRWTGTPNFQIDGGARITTGTEHWITARSNISFHLYGVGMSNLSIVHEDHIAAYDAGERLNPQYIEKIRDFRTIRFMNWQRTNGQNNEGQQLTSWAVTKNRNHYSYAQPEGVPPEVMVDVANRVGADPWFCMPHLADDDYLTQFATLVRDTLDPRLVAFVEYSNEVWNLGTFGQAIWAREQALQLWPNETWEWMQFYAGRAVNMARIWRQVFAGQEHRLNMVLSSQPGQYDFMKDAADAPLWRATNPDNLPPSAYFDSFAVTGYFGNGLGTSDYAQELLNILSASGEAAAMTRVFELLQTEMNGIQARFEGYKAFCDERGLDLVMYEGGSHAAPVGAWVGNTALASLLNKAARDARMGALYTQLLDAWKAAGGKATCLFTDMEMDGPNGAWGKLRHNYDTTPRDTAVRNWNTANPGWWETRDSNAFYDRAP